MATPESVLASINRLIETRMNRAVLEGEPLQDAIDELNGQFLVISQELDLDGYIFVTLNGSTIEADIKDWSNDPRRS